jgi:hypothetical protein
MSTHELYPYFDPAGQIQWEGEVLSPADVGDTDVGQATAKANADHQHGLFYGPWNSIALANPWVIYGAPYRSPEYARVGGTCIIRGMIKGGTVGQTIGILPVGYIPKTATEMFICWGQGGASRVDLRADGTLIASESNPGVGSGAYGYLSLGPNFYSTD